MAKRQGATEGKPAVSAEQKALNNAISQIEKTFGAGAIMKLGEGSHMEVEGISTGALSLDLALGGKGLPRGRIIELFGPESSGKTTIALHAVAQAQQTAASRRSSTPSMRSIPRGANDWASISKRFWSASPAAPKRPCRSPRCWCFPMPSTSSSSTRWPRWCPGPRSKGRSATRFVGVQARLMSQALRKLTGGVSRSKCVLIFINQIREKIGVMFGSPETTPGGRALKFYSSCRIDVRRIGPVKDGEEVVGSRIKAKVVKNKVAPPFRVCEFDMMYTHGISREADLLDLAIIDKLVDKSGSWFNYGDLRLGQGRENAKQYLRDNPEVANEIAAKILASRTASGASTGSNGVADDGADG